MATRSPSNGVYVSRGGGATWHRGGKPSCHSPTLLHRLSLPRSSSSPTGTPLLEGIGEKSTPDWMNGKWDTPFTTSPHVSTPDPAEVDRFLESVLAMDTCLPALALDTLPHSPTPSVNLTPDHCPSPPPDDVMPPPSPATLNECRKHLAPVLLAATQVRDPATRLDAQQCARLLSDDHCMMLLKRAKEMRLQLVPARPPSSPLKRDRGDEAWTRRTRARLDSTHTDASRRDSDITLVDFPGGKLPPKAPRAMLLASQPRSLNDAKARAPEEALSTSSTSRATALLELVHRAMEMCPALLPPAGSSDPAPEPLSSSNTTDFITRLPTQPGIWFRQQGRRHAEIVDIDIDVADDMFYMSRERVPSRLRVHLRLCSMPMSAAVEAPASLQDMDGVIERQFHWPKKGTLVVQVNPESERSKTWLPYTLESDALDVTSCMRPGKNTFRFIQLSDLSEFAFMLAASPPSPEEVAWRSWDWASLFAPDPRSSLNDDPIHSLSEFAHIPVTLRS